MVERGPIFGLDGLRLHGIVPTAYSDAVDGGEAARGDCPSPEIFPAFVNFEEADLGECVADFDFEQDGVVELGHYFLLDRLGVGTLSSYVSPMNLSHF